MLLQLPSSSRSVPSLLPTTPQGASAGAELVTSDGRSLALVSAHLRGVAQGGLARLVLEQRFENTYDENLHVTYRMPLPADGAVSGYEFEIGARTIKGAIDRKARARERFERAVVEGRTAALLEQERGDIFTQQIGNIPARETVIARITVDQRLVWLPEGEWELRFPTVIGPRYIGRHDSMADARATHVKVTDQPLRATIQIEIAIADAIVGGGRPSSPSHSVERRADGMTELRAGARLDRDIVLRWAVAKPTVGLSLANARPAERGPDVTTAPSDAFGLLTLVPPARDAKPLAVARDLIVLIDTSGSMSGGPLDKAKQVIAMMLDSLDEQDRFELIEFSNAPHRYLEEPIAASAKAKQAAIKWVRALEADGATEMRSAVIEAMTTLRVGAQRQVVVVTDGYVGGERQILEAINRRLPKSCRIHVLGVGSAVNRSLATAIARAGRGVEVIVGLDEDAERGAKRLLDRTRMPVLTNVEIGGSALLRHAPEHIPDVFEGAPLVAALALRPEGGELVVRGQLARESWEQTIRVPALAPGEGNQAIVALYGRERVADVEANALFGTVDGEIEELGLTFQIATRMTSWIAVDETRRVTGPSRSQLIPQELPHGTKAQAFGLRGSAPMAPPAAAPASMVTRAGGLAQTDFAVRSLSLGAVDKEAAFDDIEHDTGRVYASEAYADDEHDGLFEEEAAMEPPTAAPMSPRMSSPTAPGSLPGPRSAPPPQAAASVDEPEAVEPEAVERKARAEAAPPAQRAKRAAAPEPQSLRGMAPLGGESPLDTMEKVTGKPATLAAKTAPRSRKLAWIAAIVGILAVIALLLWWLLG